MIFNHSLNWSRLYSSYGLSIAGSKWRGRWNNVFANL